MPPLPPSQPPPDSQPPAPVEPEPTVAWVAAEDNPWTVPVIDVQPVTQTLVAASQDPQGARNLLTLSHSTGVEFIGHEPRVPRMLEAELTFACDGMLADGVLFVPRVMEHKWAIFAHRPHLYFVRSWTRHVHVVAQYSIRGDTLTIQRLNGMLCVENEPADYTVRAVDFLLRTHALGEDWPAPLPPGFTEPVDVQEAALWCFSTFGSRVRVATPHAVQGDRPTRPLRTVSLLHLAVARGDTTEVDRLLAAQTPVDVLAPDGLAPLHWARTPAMLDHLLHAGSGVDARTTEGATGLMLAAQENHLERAQWFVDRGADVNARDHRGFTALHRAADLGHVEFVRWLLSRGADKHIVAKDITALGFARLRKHTAVIDLLAPSADNRPRRWWQRWFGG